MSRYILGPKTSWTHNNNTLRHNALVEFTRLCEASKVCSSCPDLAIKDRFPDY